VQQEPNKKQVLTVTTHDLDIKAREDDQPLKVLHYNWNHIHHKWLNDMMKGQLGEMENIGRVDFPNMILPPWLQQTRKIHPTPTRAFGIRYDIRLKVQESADPVAEARLWFMELLQKIQEVDQHVVVYPWMDTDHCSREPAINDPKAIPTLLSSMKKYAHRMPIWQKGGLIYPQVFWLHWPTRQNHGEHKMVVMLNETRHVEGTITTGRRNNRTWVAPVLSRQIW